MSQRVPGIGLIVLGLGAATGAILGPLVLGIIEWRVSSNAENQVLGGDAMTLILTVPVSIVAGVLWWRGHRLAPVLALAPSLYSLYTFASLILGSDYGRYSGNNEKAYPLFLGLVILSWIISGRAWSSIDVTTLPDISRRLRRSIAGALIFIGSILALAWASQISQVIAAGTLPSDYQEDPITFWVIKTFDLAFVVPIALATGIGLLLRRPLALKAAYGIVGFMTLMGAAVSSMGVIMLIKDDPSATIILPVIFSTMTIVFGGLAAGLYRLHLTVGPSARDRTMGVSDGARLTTMSPLRGR